MAQVEVLKPECRSSTATLELAAGQKASCDSVELSMRLATPAEGLLSCELSAKSACAKCCATEIAIWSRQTTSCGELKNEILPENLTANCPSGVGRLSRHNNAASYSWVLSAMIGRCGFGAMLKESTGKSQYRHERASARKGFDCRGIKAGHPSDLAAILHETMMGSHRRRLHVYAQPTKCGKDWTAPSFVLCTFRAMPVLHRYAVPYGSSQYSIA